MRLFFALILAMFLTQFSVAQTDSLAGKKIIDSLTQKFRKDSARIYRFQRVRPYFSLDNRNTVIKEQNGSRKENAANFKGVQLGIILNENNTFGLGFYAINQNSKKPFATKDGTVSVQKSLSMNYMTVFYIHSFVDKRHFELNMPLEVGFGGYKITLGDSVTHKTYKEISGGIIPIGVGLQANFYPFREKWVGLSLLLGYRAVLDKDVNQNFNGAYSSIGVCFDIRQIYRDLKYHSKRKHYRRNVKKVLNP